MDKNLRGFQKSDYNPFKKDTKPKVKQFTKPDPSKRQVCGQDQPIKMNPTGKYNLNFIDW